MGTRALNPFISTTRKAGTLVLAEHVNNGLNASTRRYINPNPNPIRKRVYIYVCVCVVLLNGVVGCNDRGDAGVRSGVGFVSDHKRNVIPIRKRVYIFVVATSVVISRLGLGLI